MISSAHTLEPFLMQAYSSAVDARKLASSHAPLNLSRYMKDYIPPSLSVDERLECEMYACDTIGRI